jgi:hypothetical protein
VPSQSTTTSSTIKLSYHKSANPKSTSHCFAFGLPTVLPRSIRLLLSSRAMTKARSQNLVGAAIVFGSVTSRAFVGRHDYQHHGTFRDIELRPSRKRTLPSKEHGESSLFLPSKSIAGFYSTRILQSKQPNIDPSFEDLLQFELLSSISAVSEEDWDRCLCSESSPFMEHSWLRCLEEAGCATVDTGWMPSHVLIRMDDRVCGFVPVTFVLLEFLT